ncbi:MAG: D-glycerate dehydrogenase [alpha proteobacterium MED-G10]|jgi:lactate dehydrogenase-like 2-hydroxyacid dehydrogenase|nr:D-glycerate dehydrogenase [Rickettsiales bacterium]PDH56273.1 MAG: D-glycerate dehydrogenase [alpha proteobacterium MED-G10]|tara:strand:+ start:4882 stop:5856 length:975 start_codon:yes stop_codon:yes gene_type:complete
MTEKFKILVTRKWPKKVEEKLLSTFDTTLNVEDKPLSEAELIEGMRSYDALLPTVTDPITDKIISTQDRKVKIIGNFGVGFNNIDIDSAKNNKVVVTNTPEVLTDCTADIAMLLMLGVARRGSEGEFHVRKKEWSGWRPTHMMGTKVTGKTLGLIGMGRIAQAMAHKSHFGFNMKIIFFDPYFDNAEVIKKFGATKLSSIDEVLSQADFVSLHCPSTKETKGLINKETISKMKNSAYLINTARGDIVNESELVEALKEERIMGAGLDVYEKEPSVEKDLISLKNVFLLPHLGSATNETREAMGMRVFDNISAFFNNKEPLDRVV